MTVRALKKYPSITVVITTPLTQRTIPLAEWPFLDASYIKVFNRKKTTGILEELLVTRDYSVDCYEIAISNNYGLLTFNKSYIPEVGDLIVIVRATALSQETEFDSQQIVADDLNKAVDKLTYETQEVALAYSAGVIKLPPDLINSNIDFTIPANYADKYLKFKADGKGLDVTTGLSMDYVRAFRISDDEPQIDVLWDRERRRGSIPYFSDTELAECAWMPASNFVNINIKINELLALITSTLVVAQDAERLGARAIKYKKSTDTPKTEIDFTGVASKRLLLGFDETRVPLTTSVGPSLTLVEAGQGLVLDARPADPTGEYPGAVTVTADSAITLGSLASIDVKIDGTSIVKGADGTLSAPIGGASYWETYTPSEEGARECLRKKDPTTDFEVNVDYVSGLKFANAALLLSANEATISYKNAEGGNTKLMISLQGAMLIKHDGQAYFIVTEEMLATDTVNGLMLADDKAYIDDLKSKPWPREYLTKRYFVETEVGVIPTSTPYGKATWAFSGTGLWISYPRDSAWGHNVRYDLETGLVTTQPDSANGSYVVNKGIKFRRGKQLVLREGRYGSGSNSIYEVCSHSISKQFNSEKYGYLIPARPTTSGTRMLTANVSSAEKTVTLSQWLWQGWGAGSVGMNTPAVTKTMTIPSDWLPNPSLVPRGPIGRGKFALLPVMLDARKITTIGATFDANGLLSGLSYDQIHDADIPKGCYGFKMRTVKGQAVAYSPVVVLYWNGETASGAYNAGQRAYPANTHFPIWTEVGGGDMSRQIVYQDFFNNAISRPFAKTESQPLPESFTLKKGFPLRHWPEQKATVVVARANSTGALALLWLTDAPGDAKPTWIRTATIPVAPGFAKTRVAKVYVVGSGLYLLCYSKKEGSALWTPGIMTVTVGVNASPLSGATFVYSSLDSSNTPQDPEDVYLGKGRERMRLFVRGARNPLLVLLRPYAIFEVVPGSGGTVTYIRRTPREYSYDVCRQRKLIKTPMGDVLLRTGMNRIVTATPLGG